MELYLLRHGAAEDSNKAGDAARELTPIGRDRAALVIRTASGAGMKPSVILSSPYIRAKQTAEFAGNYAVIESLVPYGTPEGVWNDVRDYADEPAVLLVGHEPLLSTLAAWLLGAPALRVDMKKSAMIRIEVGSTRGQPHGVLRWMLTPALCH